MKKCKFCSEDIQDSAEICKHCNKKQKTFTKKEKIIVAVIFALFLIPGIVSIFSEEPGSDNKITGDKVYITTQTFVKDVLKAPSTAKFPFGEYQFTEIGNNKYSISSYVDSQNSFGAQIRSNYSMIVVFKGGEWADPNNWEVEELIFDEKNIY